MRAFPPHGKASKKFLLLSALVSLRIQAFLEKLINGPNNQWNFTAKDLNCQNFSRINLSLDKIKSG